MKAKVSIFGVQPLTYEDNIKEKIYIDFSSLDYNIKNDMPDWMKSLDNVYRQDHIYSIPIYSKPLDNVIDGANFNFTAHLLCNTYLNFFTIVFELVSAECLCLNLDTNSIREILTLTDDDRRIPAVRESIDKAFRLVSYFLGIEKDYIKVLNNSCNITIFFEYSKDILSKIEDKNCYEFIKSDFVERTTAGRKKIYISDNTEVLFGGRVHLVASLVEGDICIIKNILFNLQVIWFFVPVYIKIASRIHFNIISGSSSYSVDELEEKSEIISYISQTVKLQNESYKLYYESLRKLLYDKIEGLWGVEDSIKQLQNYSVFFDRFIKSTREKQARFADEILNYVLAALAIFGVVGFWADALHAEIIIKEWKTFGRFEKSVTSSLFGFSTIIFVIIGLFSAIALIYYSFRVKHGKRKSRKRKGKKRNIEIERLEL